MQGFANKLSIITTEFLLELLWVVTVADESGHCNILAVRTDLHNYGRPVRHATTKMTIYYDANANVNVSKLNQTFVILLHIVFNEISYYASYIIILD